MLPGKCDIDLSEDNANEDEFKSNEFDRKNEWFSFAKLLSSVLDIKDECGPVLSLYFSSSASFKRFSFARLFKREGQISKLI